MKRIAIHAMVAACIVDTLGLADDIKKAASASRFLIIRNYLVWDQLEATPEFLVNIRKTRASKRPRY